MKQLTDIQLAEVNNNLDNYFALATDGGYTKEQILDMEFQEMKILSYKLHPITLCTWANWYMNMWDIYAD